MIPTAQSMQQVRKAHGFESIKNGHNDQPKALGSHSGLATGAAIDYRQPMEEQQTFEAFATVLPGLESLLAEEIRELGFVVTTVIPGGVTFAAEWPDIWRANLWLRGATRVLVRIGSFRALHLAQLDKRASKFHWGDFLRPDFPVRVEATCRKSRIYHAGAAKQRVENAIAKSVGVKIDDNASLCVKVRIEDDLCSFSLDTSGDPLHKRGHKQAVGKAPLRETMAALYLRACGFDGQEPVVDPMCGSGTFVIEAAEIAAGLAPGRTRRFAFEDLSNFDPEIWQALKAEKRAATQGYQAYGFDRDDGAIRNATANAERAGLAGSTTFARQAVSELIPPDGPKGLVMVNPPYGGRIGNKKLLFGVYGAFGKTMKERFSGWRVGLVTNEEPLARATGLPFAKKSDVIPHGGLKVRLYQTESLR